MLLIAVVFALLAPGAAAQELAAGIRQVDEGDLENAVVTLEAVVARLDAEKGPERERALGHLYLGMAYLGLEQSQRARSSLRNAWRFNQGTALDPKQFPPRVIALYEEVGRELEPARASAEETKRERRKRNPVVVPDVAGLAVGAGAASIMRGRDGSVAPPSPGPTQPPLTPAALPATVRLFNCDDACRVFLNGAPVGEVGIGQDTGLLDVTHRLVSGPNAVTFELVNAHGGITYGFEVRLGDALVFQQACGLVFRDGCEEARKFPTGVVRQFTYVLAR
jgi:hypothetical protein